MVKIHSEIEYSPPKKFKFVSKESKMPFTIHNFPTVNITTLLSNQNKINECGEQHWNANYFHELHNFFFSAISA